MTCEQRCKLVEACVQIAQRGAVSVLCHAHATLVAEDVGEEHLDIVGIGLEQNQIGFLVLTLVLFHPDLHP